MPTEAGGVAFQAAVIGSPVRHSLSPVLHRAAYAAAGLDGWTYTRWEVGREDLPQVVAEVAAAPAEGAPLWAGLSVTMPDKQALMPLLDMVDPLAAAVGAVNTVVAQRSGRGQALLAGFNTDVAGIVGALREAQGDPASGEGLAGRPALILGSGATACSALAALTQMGAGPLTVAARRHAGPGRAATAAHRMGLEIETLTWDPADPAACAQLAARAARVARAAGALVSTLPAHGADVLAQPLARELQACRAHEDAVLLDAVYEPWPTALSSAWQQGGGVIAPGWLMLLHQAVPQVRLMTGRAPDTRAMRHALRNALDSRAQMAGMWDHRGHASMDDRR